MYVSGHQQQIGSIKLFSLMVIFNNENHQHHPHFKASH